MALIRQIVAYRYMLASVAGLFAALLALTYVVVRALSGVGNATAGLCHDPPALHGSLDQVPVVLVCVACFVGGRAVSWSGARHKAELNDRLGENAWRDRRSVVVVKAALTLFLFLLSALMALEALMLLVGIWPITFYVRCSTEANSSIALLGAGTFTFLTGRWFWIPRWRM